jgi:energy-coupling factor transporter ATP-binding protein EcfA2
MMELLADTAKEHGTAVLVVTHEARVAGFADRTVLMRDGAESVQVSSGGLGRFGSPVPSTFATGGDSMRVVGVAQSAVAQGMEETLP